MKKLLSYQKIALLLLGVLLLLTGASLGYLWRMSQNTAASQIADIYQNGVCIQSIPLQQMTEAYSFVVTGENNCTNTIEVRPGSIGIIDASCPDKLCVHQGFITNSLIPITCLPNNLVIQLRPEVSKEPSGTNSDTNPSDNSYDILTY